MKTYSPKIEDIKRQWFVADVKGKTLGKVATKVADIIRGKNKPTYSPHLDCGDFVVIVNVEEIKLTGNKLKDKVYNHHTRYANGLRSTTPDELIRVGKAERILFHAVAGMIPQSKLKKDILRKLKIFTGAEHKHTAQEPKVLDL